MFNPNRLIVARKRRGLSKVALARETGISAKSIAWYESGEQIPTAANVERLARSLGFPPAFFLGADLDGLPLDAASFRAFSNLTVRQQEQAWGQGTLVLSVADWIDKRFRLPDPDVPRYHGVDPETAAQAVREEWGLGEQPISNMLRLLESRGVRIFSLAEEISAVDAFSFWRSDVPYMVLNTNKSAERMRTDAAHELGHLVLHGRHERSRGRDVEHEAFTFGSAFLMPRADVKAQLPMGGRLPELLHAKSRWKVSVASLVFWLHKLELVSEWDYRTMFKEISRRGYRKKEPRAIRPETSDVLMKVLAVLRREGTTPADMANDLGLSRHELNTMMFGLVLTVVEGEAPKEETRDQAKPNLRVV
jgi:Zn-dependent peptidase ImmA (M78 family)/transcriptional regulator with XRE-family HTH domain